MGCVGKGLDIFIDRHAPGIERTKISLESAGDVAFPEDTGETLVMSPVSHYTRKWKSIHCKKKRKKLCFFEWLKTDVYRLHCPWDFWLWVHFNTDIFVICYMQKATWVLQWMCFENYSSTSNLRSSDSILEQCLDLKLKYGGGRLCFQGTWHCLVFILGWSIPWASKVFSSRPLSRTWSPSRHKSLLNICVSTEKAAPYFTSATSQISGGL